MIFLKIVEAGTTLTENALIPVYPEGKERVAKLKADRVFRCDLKRARSPQHHRKFYALLNKTLENQDQFKSVETLLDAIKIEVGHAEMRYKLNGETYWEPKSISFFNMDQDEFNSFYKLTMDAIRKQWDFDPETLESEANAEL